MEKTRDESTVLNDGDEEEGESKERVCPRLVCWGVATSSARNGNGSREHLHGDLFLFLFFLLPHVVAAWTATTSCVCGEDTGHAPHRSWRCRAARQGHTGSLRVLCGGELTTFHTTCTRARTGCYQYGCKPVQRTETVRERIKTMWIFPLPSF